MLVEIHLNVEIWLECVLFFCFFFNISLNKSQFSTFPFLGYVVLVVFAATDYVKCNCTFPFSFPIRNLVEVV